MGEEKRVTIEIDGVEFTFRPDKAFEKNGHVYCKKCGERIDGNPIGDFKGFSHKFIYHRQCRCVREEEERRKAEEKADEIRRLKEECFRTSRNLIECSFEDILEPEREEVMIARNFVKHFKELSKSNCGLLFHGNVGTGKTYLAACIGNGVIEEYMVRVKMRNIPQIVNEIEKGGFKIDKNAYYQELANVKLLILDDFGIERNTDYINEKVYEIINARYEVRKPTIISTNIPLESIMEGSKNIDRERIYSRIREMCIPVKIAGKDLRRELGKDKLMATKNMLLGEDR